LDGSLAYRDKAIPYDPLVIGHPLAPMVARIKYWISTGIEVRIFTARVSTDGSFSANHMRQKVIHRIQDWLEKECGLPRLEVTNEKDYKCVQIWDDIAVGLIPNTGHPLCGGNL
jgi:hypothetical protein